MVVMSGSHSFAPYLDPDVMIDDHEASSSMNHILPSKDDNHLDNVNMFVFDNDKFYSSQKAMVMSDSHHIPSHVETDHDHIDLWLEQSYRERFLIHGNMNLLFF